MRALLVLLAAGALLVQPRIPACAQVPGISFWTGARVDLIGVRGLTGSPALFGADVMLLRRFAGSPLEVGLALSASRRDQGQHTGSTFGLYSELRYGPTRAYGPYLLGSAGLANTRASGNFLDPLADEYNIGTDATTGVLGAGAGLRFRAFRTGAFLDVQYQWRTNPAHGRHVLPIRLGFRW